MLCHRGTISRWSPNKNGFWFDFFGILIESKRVEVPRWVEGDLICTFWNHCVQPCRVCRLCSRDCAIESSQQDSRVARIKTYMIKLKRKGGSHGNSAHRQGMTPSLYCIADHSHLHLMKASVAGVALHL